MADETYPPATFTRGADGRPVVVDDAGWRAAIASDEKWRCWVCNGGGTMLGVDCPCCGQETYADDPCSRCGRTGAVTEAEFREHFGDQADAIHAAHQGRKP